MFLNPSSSFRGRFRLLVAMFLLAVPLAAGVWAFCAFAGRSGEQRAESQLAGVLRGALQEHPGELAAADTRATSVAARRDVQLARLHGNRAQLARIAKALPRITL